jgi:hypothetical protein
MATLQNDNRFSPITPDNHAGPVWITALLCLIYSVVTFALRGHLRWKMWGLDDYLALVATVSRALCLCELGNATDKLESQIIQVGEVVAVLVGLNHGLGKTEDLLLRSQVDKASRVNSPPILFICRID